MIQQLDLRLSGIFKPMSASKMVKKVSPLPCAARFECDIIASNSGYSAYVSEHLNAKVSFASPLIRRPVDPQVCLERRDEQDRRGDAPDSSNWAEIARILGRKHDRIEPMHALRLLPEEVVSMSSARAKSCSLFRLVQCTGLRMHPTLFIYILQVCTLLS